MMTMSMHSVRRVVRDSAFPMGDVLRTVRVRTPSTVTLAGGERSIIGSGWATGAVVVSAAVLAAWAYGGGAYVQTLVGLFAAYLVAALGYNVVLGNAGQFAFCQNAFMAIGAYGFAVTQPHLGAVLGIVVGAGVATLAGTVIGVSIIRTREIYLALLTLAFSQAALLAIQLWRPTQGDNGILALLGGDNAYLIALVGAAISVLLVQRVLRSKVGTAFALVRTDEKAAAAMGINVPVARTLAFAFSSFLGGIGGVLLAGMLTFITPTNFTLELTLLLLTMIVIGGVGSVWGTVVGVAIMVLIQQYLPGSGSTGSYIDAALLFVILATRPAGLRSLVTLRSGTRRG